MIKELIENLKNKIERFSLFGPVCESCNREVDEDMLCDVCQDEYVCDECATPYTYHNPIEKRECPSCKDSREMEYWNESI